MNLRNLQPIIYGKQWFYMMAGIEVVLGMGWSAADQSRVLTVVSFVILRQRARQHLQLDMKTFSKRKKVKKKNAREEYLKL